LLNLYDRSNVLAADIYAGVPFTPWFSLRSSLQASIESERDTQSRLSLRELFFKFSPTSALDFTLGRVILKWGTGYAYNPTGVIEPRRDPSDPSDRLRRFRGLDLVQADFYFRASSLTLVYLKYLWSPLFLQKESVRNVRGFDDHNQDPQIAIEKAKIEFQLGNHSSID
jgi:hypothetical protein